jgi:hypothetical protein
MYRFFRNRLDGWVTLVEETEEDKIKEYIENDEFEEVFYL